MNSIYVISFYNALISSFNFFCHHLPFYALSDSIIYFNYSSCSFTEHISRLYPSRCWQQNISQLARSLQYFLPWLSGDSLDWRIFNYRKQANPKFSTCCYSDHRVGLPNRTEIGEIMGEHEPNRTAASNVRFVWMFGSVGFGEPTLNDQVSLPSLPDAPEPLRPFTSKW